MCVIHPVAQLRNNEQAKATNSAVFNRADVYIWLICRVKAWPRVLELKCYASPGDCYGKTARKIRKQWCNVIP